MSQAGIPAVGSLRAPFAAAAALPFLVLALVGLVTTARSSGPTDLGPATLLCESLAIVLGIVAIWTGDETTRRGRAGRRAGMLIVIATVGLELSVGAILR